ncbi:MAG: protoporphyrinogen oxidase [Candidatus Acidiferrales bacterium]
MPQSKNAIVIGGGISGLACAFRLQRLGIPVILLESASRVGGLMGTIEKDGLLFESGPQSFQGTESILELTEQAGIKGELLFADPRAPRYVLRQGKLQEIPMSPKALMTSSLLTAGSRWKIASEPFKKSHPPSKEESVADFVRRKFGHEILEYLVAPFVSGVYAGDPEMLSLRAAFPTLEEWEREYGSVLRGAIKSRPEKEKRTGPPPLCSFRRGVSTLAQAIGEKLSSNLRAGARVLSVHRTGESSSRNYEVRITTGGREETITTAAVVIATPAYISAHLVGTVSPPLAQSLSGIAYAPVAVVAAGYYAKQIGRSTSGFGFLVPRTEKLRTLGTVWNSSLFPGRAPDGMVVMTSFAGGATDPAVVEKSEEEIAAIVHAENARVLQITGPPVASSAWRYAKALPQYNLGHGHVVESIRNAERAKPGLFIAGNYLEGPALGKCIEVGNQTAEAVVTYLKSSK